MDWTPASIPPKEGTEVIIVVDYKPPYTTHAVYTESGFERGGIRYLPGKVKLWAHMPEVPTFGTEICQCCGKNKGLDLHVCPYAEEINGSSETCNCCKECTHQCEI